MPRHSQAQLIHAKASARAQLINAHQMGGSAGGSAPLVHAPTPSPRRDYTRFSPVTEVGGDKKKDKPTGVAIADKVDVSGKGRTVNDGSGLTQWRVGNKRFTQAEFDNIMERGMRGASLNAEQRAVFEASRKEYEESEAEKKRLAEEKRVRDIKNADRIEEEKRQNAEWDRRQQVQREAALAEEQRRRGYAQEDFDRRQKAALDAEKRAADVEDAQWEYRFSQSQKMQQEQIRGELSELENREDMTPREKELVRQQLNAKLYGMKKLPFEIEREDEATRYQKEKDARDYDLKKEANLNAKMASVFTALSKPQVIKEMRNVDNGDGTTSLVPVERTVVPDPEETWAKVQKMFGALPSSGGTQGDDRANRFAAFFAGLGGGKNPQSEASAPSLAAPTSQSGGSAAPTPPADENPAPSPTPAPQDEAADLLAQFPNAKPAEGESQEQFTNRLRSAREFYSNKQQGIEDVRATNEVGEAVVGGTLDWLKSQFSIENIKRGFGAK